MNIPNCLQQAMFAASENYSHTTYVLEDCVAEDEGNDAEIAAVHVEETVFEKISFAM